MTATAVVATLITAVVAIAVASTICFRSFLLFLHFLGSIEQRRLEGLDHFAGAARFLGGAFKALFRGQCSRISLEKRKKKKTRARTWQLAHAQIVEYV